MTAAPRPMPWSEVGRMFFSPLQVRMWGPDTLSDPQPWTGCYVRVNVSDPYPSPALQPDTWYTIDLRPLGVGYDPVTGLWIGADMAFMSGIEIITGGSQQAVDTNGNPVYPDVQITFARPEDTTADLTRYIGQTLDPLQIGGGSRTNMSTVIPLTDGQYKFSFHDTTVGQYPTQPSYGINLTLQLWGVKK